MASKKPKIKLNCKSCNTQIVTWPSLRKRKKFCSKACFYKGRELKNLFEKGHGDLVPTSSRGHTQATKAKMRAINKAKAKRGSNNPRWRGNRTERATDMQSAEYKLWREAVFVRDDYTCQICDDRGVTLHADHIKSYTDHPELRHDVSNGRALCVPCHYYVTFRRKMPLGANWCNYTHRERG